MEFKDYRKRQGLSQAKFAEKYGFRLRTLQDWEQGRRRPPEYVIKMLSENDVNSSNIFTEAIISKGEGDTDGNPTTNIEFSGCYSSIYGEISEREEMMFKKGVLAERDRIFDELGDILDEETCSKIKKSKLFNR